LNDVTDRLQPAAWSASLVRLLVLVSMTLALAGCLVGPMTYLKPSAPGAKYTGSKCAGFSAPQDRIWLSGPEGIVIGVGVNAARAQFDIALFVPPAASVRFESGVFSLTDELTKAVYQYRAEYVVDVYGPITPGKVGRPHIDIREPLSGTRRKPADSPGYSIGHSIGIDPQYFIYPSFNVYSKQFRLRIPPLVAAGKTFEFPEVSFREVTESIAAPFNC
jgi:hypothetical protein